VATISPSSEMLHLEKLEAMSWHILHLKKAKALGLIPWPDCSLKVLDVPLVCVSTSTRRSGTRTVLLTSKLELGPQTNGPECLLLVCECNGSGTYVTTYERRTLRRLAFSA